MQQVNFHPPSLSVGLQLSNNRPRGEIEKQAGENNVNGKRDVQMTGWMMSGIRMNGKYLSFKDF